MTWPRRVVRCGVVAALVCAAGRAHGLTLTGSIQTEDGAPAVAARVWLASPWEVWQTGTDSAGAFRFEGLGVDEYVLIAAVPGMAHGLWQGVLAGDHRIALTVAPSVALRYRVVTHGVEPVPNARVAVAIPNREVVLPLERLQAHGFPMAVSGSDGHLDLNGFPDGSTVEVVIKHHDYAAAYVPSLVAGTQFTVHLEPGQRVRGRVTGEDGAPLVNARVTLFRPYDAGQTTLCEAYTDSDGYYRMRAASLDGVLLTARAQGYPASPPQSVTGESADVRLARAGKVTGRVVDGDGRALPGTMVFQRQEAWLPGHAHTGPDGRYALDVAPGGGVVAVAVPQGKWADGAREQPLVAGGATQDLDPFVLRDLPAITGNVVDEDGTAIARALVWVQTGGGVEGVLTDAAGAFSLALPPFVEGDAVTVRVEHPERFRRAEKSVPLREPLAGTLALRPYEPGTGLPEAGKRNEDWLAALEAAAWVNTPEPGAMLRSARVILVTYWSSLDPGPVNRRRLALVQMLHEQFAEVPEVAVVAVHERGVDAEGLAQILEAWGLTLPVAVDDSAGTAFVASNVVSVPRSVLFDGAGRVRLPDVPETALLESLKLLRREH